MTSTRPSKKKPVKPSAEELRDRVEFTVFLLSRRLYKCDIKRILKKRYNVEFRACEDYLARARKILLEDTGRTREQHRIESLRLYESIVAGDGSSVRDILHAQERIDKLLGLEAPQKHDVTTNHRAEDLSDDELAAIIAAERSPGGQGNHPPSPGPIQPD